MPFCRICGLAVTFLEIMFILDKCFCCRWSSYFLIFACNIYQLYFWHITWVIYFVIVSITKYLLVIGSARAYLLRNCSAVMWVSNCSCPIWTFCNWIVVIGQFRCAHQSSALNWVLLIVVSRLSPLFATWIKYIHDVLSKGKKRSSHILRILAFVIDTINW